jgi:hypothetical protein
VPVITVITIPAGLYKVRVTLFTDISVMLYYTLVHSSALR